MEKKFICTEPKNNLESKVESYIYVQLSEHNYSIYQTSAREFITPNRVDVWMKLVYLQLKDRSPNYAQSIYLQHIRAFSYGRFEEAYNTSKKGIDTFLTTFDEISIDIQQNGFDASQSILALTDKGEIQNGSHRVSAAIFHHKDVAFIETNRSLRHYNVDYFWNRGVEMAFILHAANTILQYDDRIQIGIGTEHELRHVNEHDSLELLFSHHLNLTQKGAANLSRYCQVDTSISSSEQMYVMLFRGDIHANEITALAPKEEKADWASFLLNPNTPFLLNNADFSIQECVDALIQVTQEAALVDPNSILPLFGIGSFKGIEYLKTAETTAFSPKDDVTSIPSNYYYFKGKKIAVITAKILQLTVNETTQYTQLVDSIKLEERQKERLKKKQHQLFVRNKMINKFLKKIGNLFRKLGVFELVNRVYSKLT